MAFGTNYICVPSKAELLSNQIFTYRFSHFSPFLIMEGTKTKEQWNCIKSNEDWKKKPKYLSLSQFLVPHWTTRLATISDPSVFH